jgi:hypothetical protein
MDDTSSIVLFSTHRRHAAAVNALLDEVTSGSPITYLDLWGCALGNEGACILAGILEDNDTIQNIDLGLNNIGTEGIISLANAIKNNRTIITLDLGDNWVDDEGARYLAEAFAVNNTLRYISLWQNEFGNEGASHLLAALESNSVITDMYIVDNQVDDVIVEKINQMLDVNSRLKRVGWSPQNHLEWNDKSKDFVLTLLLVRMSDNNLLTMLPNELLFNIISLTLCM